MPKRLCTHSGCKAIVDVPVGYRDSPRCERHRRAVTHSKRVYDHHHEDGKNIYKSQRWVRLRAELIRQQPTCQHCLQYGIVTPGKIVDHIVEIEDGGAVWDIDNLQHLCHTCHNIKTGREAVKRKKRADNEGFGNLSDF
jgi:5-methylcytosine-specific restriction protein A